MPSESLVAPQVKQGLSGGFVARQASLHPERAGEGAWKGSHEVGGGADGNEAALAYGGLAVEPCNQNTSLRVVLGQQPVADRRALPRRPAGRGQQESARLQGQVDAARTRAEARASEIERLRLGWELYALAAGIGVGVSVAAGSGVGKSMLLSMMTRNTEADVVVVGLVGERGREVQEFIDRSLGSEGMKRAVVVATPADDTPLMRLHGAWLTAAIAEYFRDQGQNVLLLMDSLTRFAQAQREIALAIGEPPATKGYPPSVFAKLPQLVERAGNGDHGGGSITAFYTVLVEGDDQNDPIADAARAILDGHIVLSRPLVESGQYPAIDIEASVSRAMNEITSKAHQRAAREFKQLYSVYQQNRDLISVGAYEAGSNEQIDLAIGAMPSLREFLHQDMRTRFGIHDSLDDLLTLFPPEQLPMTMADG